ncbi:polyadenylate-binding protein RBP45, partial [Tanacetum coccineum]
VVSGKVIRNKQTGQSEGYGFIEFVNRAAAERQYEGYDFIEFVNCATLYS